jgi:hypothetical protein
MGYLRFVSGNAVVTGIHLGVTQGDALARRFSHPDYPMLPEDLT